MGAFSDFTAYASQTGAQLSNQPLIFEKASCLNATQHALFDYVSDFTRLDEWVLGAKRSWVDDSHAETPGQVGAVRVIESPVGAPVREVVKAFEAPRMFAYSANDEALRGLCTDHLSVITCEPHPDGGTVLCWQAYGRLPSQSVKAWAGKKLFQTVLNHGLKKLERKFPPR